MTSAPGRNRSLNGYATVSAVVGAVAFAFLMAWVIGPGEPPIPFEQAEVESYFERFGPNGTERAEEYRGRSRLIGLAGTILELSVLAFFAFYRGRPVSFVLEKASRRPLPGAAAVGALLAIAVAVATLPLSLLAFDLGRDYDLVTQGLGGWFGDRMLSLAFSVLLAAAAAAAGLAAWRRFRRWFWVAASVIAMTFAVAWLWFWPVVVSPLFNQFDALPEGPLRSEVMRLADRADVDVGEVYEVDASRRSVAINAYVHGIGSSKRVVIYDNAITQLPPDQLSFLLAHELAHVESRDIYRGLLFAILVIPLGALAIQLSISAIITRNGDRRDGPAVVTALALAFAVATLLLSVPGNQLSREIEIQADYRALELTDDPGALAGLQRRLAANNLSDPDPPAGWHFIFGTHPTTLERIGLAESWTAEEEAGEDFDSDGGAG